MWSTAICWPPTPGAAGVTTGRSKACGWAGRCGGTGFRGAISPPPGGLQREGLAPPGDRPPVAARSTALVSAGGCKLAQGDYGGARPLVEEGLAIARVLEDRKGIARC